MSADRALFLCTLGNISGRNPSCHSCAVVLNEQKVCLHNSPQEMVKLLDLKNSNYNSWQGKHNINNNILLVHLKKIEYPFHMNLYCSK